MKVLLLGGNNGHWTLATQPNPTLHGIESWLIPFDGGLYRNARTLTRDDLMEYDLIFANIHLDCEHYIPILDATPDRRAVVVGIQDDDANLLSGWWREWGAIADRMDLIVSLSRITHPYLQTLTRTPVENIGLPVPVDEIATYRVPVAERRREIYLCPSRSAMTNPTPSSSTPYSYLAARDLGLPMWTKGHGWEGVEGVTVEPETSSQVEFLRRAAQSLLWMDLDPRHTWCRFVIEGACLGVPVIAPRNTGHADVLFPRLPVPTAFDIETATNHARWLIKDERFYRDVVNDATVNLSVYKPDAVKARLLATLERLGKLPTLQAIAWKEEA